MKAKYILSIGLLFFSFALYPRQRGSKGLATVTQEVSNIRRRAFEILNAKCNFCHRNDNPSKVFTPENMNDYAPRIHRQVFVWHRMPKNNAVTLSAEEQETLKHWLRDNNIQVKD